EIVLVHALAAERDEQHRADVRMRRDALEHLLRIAVRIAARKTDQVDGNPRRRLAVFPRVLARPLVEARLEGGDDLVRDMMRALDEIADRDRIADALAAIRAEITLEECCVRHDPALNVGRTTCRRRACKWECSRSRDCAYAGARPWRPRWSRGRSRRR